MKLLRPTLRDIARLRDFVFRKERGPVRYAFGAIVCAWVVAIGLAAAIDLAFGSVDEPVPAEPLCLTGLLVLVFAPLIENLLMITLVAVVHRFAGTFRRSLAVAAAAAFAAATHSQFNLSHGLFAACLFGTMAFTYLEWSELRWRQRYALTVFQHALANLVPMTVLVVDRVG